MENAPKSNSGLRPLASARAELLAFVRRRGTSEADAEDILQQAFLRAARNLEQLRDPGLLRPWFYRILRRAIADHRDRGAASEQRARLFAAEQVQVEGQLFDPCSCSTRIAASLPARYAQLLRRIDVNGEEPAVVARSLQTTTGNIAVRLHRARQALRHRLRSACGTTTVRDCADCSCDNPNLSCSEV